MSTDRIASFFTSLARLFTAESLICFYVNPVVAEVSALSTCIQRLTTASRLNIANSAGINDEIYWKNIKLVFFNYRENKNVQCMYMPKLYHKHEAGETIAAANHSSNSRVLLIISNQGCHDSLQNATTIRKLQNKNFDNSAYLAAIHQTNLIWMSIILC